MCAILEHKEIGMNQIEVVAAAIVKNGKLFIAKRPNKGEVGLKWEFPGGKIEPGETKEEAIKREISEELSAVIDVSKFITTVEYQYNSFHLTMHVFLCNLTGNDPIIREHVDSCWITKDQINNFDWAPADLKILDQVKEACFISDKK